MCKKQQGEEYEDALGGQGVKDLALFISLEAAGLLEVFQWSGTDVVCKVLGGNDYDIYRYSK